MRKIILLLIFTVVIGCFLESCNKQVYSPETIDFEKVPLMYLDEYGFFEGDMKEMKPSDRVLPYEPISTLFSDYSHKSRFVWMPEGASASITAKENGELEFPEKSILIKNFYYPQAEGGKQRIMETRLLVKKSGKWEAYAYIWNEEQTEAVHKITGANMPVSFTDEHGGAHQISYIQPNKNQCKSCHNQKEVLKPIGPKVRNLNFSYDYGKGEQKNQLDKWTELGYLKGFKGKDEYICMVDYTDENAPLEKRAKAYLEINCGHCHSAEGPASTSGLFLTYEEEDLRKWGVYKPPIAAGIGAGPHTYDIYPSKADSSIFIHRMKSNQPSVMMPEIGRVLPDPAGIELISEWINSMDINTK